MIAALMVHALIASGLVLVGAMAMESALRSAVPGRMVWYAAIVLSALLTGVAIADVGRGVLPGISAQSNPAAMVGTATAASDEPAPPSPLETAVDRIGRAIQSPMLAAGRLNEASSILAVGWGVLSALLLASGLAWIVRYRWWRSRWPVAEIEGTPVRITPRLGPAVVGVLRPEIVVPEWFLTSSAPDRRLALQHELEHLRARDGLILGSAWILVACTPWNPVAWWMLLRLRLAVEIDCDRRVLAGGAERRRYGSMLIDVSGHGSGLRLTAPALAGFPSTLERRLIAMTTHKHSSGAHRWVLGVLGGAAVLTACGTELPSAAQIEELDAAKVESQVVMLGIDSTAYFVDGIATTSEQAKAIPPAQIARIEVQRDASSNDGVGTVLIYTHETTAAESLAPGESGTSEVRVALDSASVNGGAVGAIEVTGFATGVVSPGRVDNKPSEAEHYNFLYGVEPDGSTTTMQVTDALGYPLFILDGVAATAEEFEQLYGSDIESISVLKGASAAEYGARGANGVVLVTTKTAAN